MTPPTSSSTSGHGQAGQDAAPVGSVGAWHSLSIQATLKRFGQRAEQGLTTEQVAERWRRFGPNELVEQAGRSNWSIFVDQFTNIMLLMLMAVAVVSAILDFRSGSFPKDAIAISLIVGLNGVLGYLQESRAEKALAALKQLASPKVRLLRNGQVVEIDSTAMVPGDIMLLEAGVQVAADGRLLEAVNLQIREASLTGEAEAVHKQADLQLPEDAPLGDRLNLVFQGTEVIQGRGKVLVTETGMRTELGRIASMLQAVEVSATPLQERMGQLANVLVSGSLTIVALVIGLGLIRLGWSAFEQLLEVSLSMAVAVVPEGLPAVITVTLALGTQRMVKRQALIRKLPAVETLGSVTTICSDKTGTLTQNKMVVQAVQTLDYAYEVTGGKGYSPYGKIQRTTDSPLAGGAKGLTVDLQLLLITGLICNDALLQKQDQAWEIVGDPTEGSLVVLAAKANYDQQEWNAKVERLAEIPFSSERRRMTVVCDGLGEFLEAAQAGGSLTTALLTKGSPELILELCSHVQQADGFTSLGELQRQRVLTQNELLAGRGLRVLGLAYRPFSPQETLTEAQEQGLIWLGLVGMLDAPRPEVAEAVHRCKQAGIHPIVITGDHQLTAKAIAADLGIAQVDDPVLDGRALERMPQAELEQHVQKVSVYARVAPEHKLRIVQALQAR
ncbi:MAG: HAD-IC family P-type ATPase, partial [Cyanobacteria bacterium P01_H01_bin.121]